MTSMTTLTISRAAATSLLGWLEAVPIGTIPVTHAGDRQALADLLTALEQAAPEASPSNLKDARAVLLDRAGPWVQGDKPS